MSLRFGAPDLLVLVPVVVVLAAAVELWRARSGGGLLFSSLVLVDGVARGWRVRLRALLPLLRVLGLALVALALARPEAAESVSEIRTTGSDVVVTLDISPSMLEQAFGRTKWDVTKDAVLDFLGKLGRRLTIGAEDFCLAARFASAAAAAPGATGSRSATAGAAWTLYKISHDNSPVSFKILVPLHGRHRPAPLPCRDSEHHFCQKQFL